MQRRVAAGLLLACLTGCPPTVAAQQPAPTQIDPVEAPASAQGPESHPEPVHTGFRSLAKDSAQDFLAFPRRRSTWAILAIAGGAAALAHPIDETANAHLRGSPAVGRFFAPGKYLGQTYTQVGVAVGLYTVGRFVVPKASEGESQTNRWSHLGFDLIRAQIVSQSITHTIKLSVRRDRPDGTCCAFPSGHAASAFAAASVIERHFGYRLAWPTLLAATYVGASRLHDNRHFVSDVIFGAAIGTASGWTIVGRHGRDKYALMPAPVRGGLMLTLVHTGANDGMGHHAGS